MELTCTGLCDTSCPYTIPPPSFPRRRNCLSFLRCSRISSPYSQPLQQLCLNSVDCLQEMLFLLQENLCAASPTSKSLVLKQSCSAPVTQLFGTTQAFNPKSWVWAPYGPKNRCEAEPRNVVIRTNPVTDQEWTRHAKRGRQ